MKTVTQLLQVKPHQKIWSVAPDASAYEAVKLMAEKGIGALLVLKEGELIGIVSERDYVRKLVLNDKSAKDTPIREIMTKQVVYIRPEQSIEVCMALMAEKGIRHLPVMDDVELVGVISIRDLVKDIISEKEFIIEQLAHYITTGY